LIIRVSQRCQVWVVSHSSILIRELSRHKDCQKIVLQKTLGQTEVQGQRPLDAPAWHWHD
ncbi:ATP-binding protein, partial [Pseudomonas fulva]